MKPSQLSACITHQACFHGLRQWPQLHSSRACQQTPVEIYRAYFSSDIVIFFDAELFPIGPEKKHTKRYIQKTRDNHSMGKRSVLAVFGALVNSIHV